jgi:hypothetical protein
LPNSYYRDLVGYKHRNLLRAYVALLAMILSMMVAVICYLRLLDGPG